MSAAKDNSGGAHEPGELEALIATEGWAAHQDVDQDVPDPEVLQAFEAAVGAVFAARVLDRSAVSTSPPEALLATLEASAGNYISDRSIPGDSDLITQFPGQAAAGAFVDESAGALASGRGSSGARAKLPGTHSSASSGGATSSTRRFGLVPVLAGWAAAAALAIAFVSANGRVSQLEAQLQDQPGARTPAEQLAALEASAPDLMSLNWLSLTEGQAAPAGGVTWSNASNEGYMKISGLEPNDPTEFQYQLWIFRGTDPGAEPHPVDGGVFDVSSSGEAVVPIDAAIQVGAAGTFAVTVEKPGGVVVSEREKIVLLAQRAG